MNFCLLFRNFPAFRTYKVIGLLVDKTLYKEDVFHLVHIMNSPPLISDANKYATLNNILSPSGIVWANHTLYNVFTRAPLFDCIAHIHKVHRPQLFIQRPTV